MSRPYVTSNYYRIELSSLFALLEGGRNIKLEMRKKKIHSKTTNLKVLNFGIKLYHHFLVFQQF